MGIAYFGQPAKAYRGGGYTRVPTPAGQFCAHCREPIDLGDRGTYVVVLADAGTSPEPIRTAGASPEPIHIECDALGILGHEFGVCSCTGWDTTSRDTAKELWWRMKQARERS